MEQRVSLVTLGVADLARARAFYEALGWTTVWTDGNGLAQLELAGHRFMLQDFYVKQWAHNSMITIDVVDAGAWYEHVAAVIGVGSYGDVRVAPPKSEEFGALVTYVWDPSGVLLHFTQWT